MHMVRHPRRAGRIAPERMHDAGGKPGLLHELSAAARRRIFTRVEEPSRQFPGKALQRRTVLPDDGKAAIRQRPDNGDVILLADRMVEFNLGLWRELNLTFDDRH